MSKKRKIIAGVGVAVLLLGAVIVEAWRRNMPSSAGGIFPYGAEVAGDMKNGQAQGTFEPLRGDVTVPEKGQADVPGNVAMPNAVNESVPDSTARDREFSIVISENAFIPDTVIVREGDVARIRFTARGEAYDVIQPDSGLRITLLPDETKLMAAQFNRAGKYKFYCESCGGPEKGPVGYLVVARREVVRDGQ